MAFLSRMFTGLWGRDRRRDKRFDFDLPFIIVKGGDHPHGVRYQAKDWSTGGFKLANHREDLKMGDTLKGEIQFLSGPRGSFVAKVVHVDPSGSIGLQFIELFPSEFLFPVKTEEYKDQRRQVK